MKWQQSCTGVQRTLETVTLWLPAVNCEIPNRGKKSGLTTRKNERKLVLRRRQSTLIEQARSYSSDPVCHELDGSNAEELHCH